MHARSWWWWDINRNGSAAGVIWLHTPHTPCMSLQSLRRCMSLTTNWQVVCEFGALQTCSASTTSTTTTTSSFSITELNTTRVEHNQTLFNSSYLTLPIAHRPSPISHTTTFPNPRTLFHSTFSTFSTTTTSTSAQHTQFSDASNSYQTALSFDKYAISN